MSDVMSTLNKNKKKYERLLLTTAIKNLWIVLKRLYICMC